MIKLSGDIWLRWKNLHRELKKREQWKLAEPFFGHETPGFRRSNKKVLYVGKATAGLYVPTAPGQNYFNCNKKAFWSFAGRLSSLTGGNPAELENIAWSNLCKIGTATGNPGKRLVAAQADLAVDTLRREWVELKPTLVVCVAEGYNPQLIYGAFGVAQGPDDGFETVTLPGGTFWRRSASNGMPAFLWMKHPQGKLRGYIEDAQALAEEMLTR